MLTAAGSVLLALLIAGIGIPLPEDLTLIGAGYLAWRGSAPLALMWAVGLIGVVAGDSMLYFIGRRLGPRLSRHKWLSHHLTPARMERVERFFLRHGAQAIFLARWAAGARGAFYLTAGTMKLSYRRFLFYDVLAASLSVTLWVLLGWRFGAHIDQLRHAVKRVEHWILLAVLLITAGWLFTRLLRRWIQGPPEPA